MADNDKYELFTQEGRAQYANTHLLNRFFTTNDNPSATGKFIVEVVLTVEADTEVDAAELAWAILGDIKAKELIEARVMNVE